MAFHSPPLSFDISGCSSPCLCCSGLPTLPDLLFPAKVEGKRGIFTTRFSLQVNSYKTEIKFLSRFRSPYFSRRLIPQLTEKGGISPSEGGRVFIISLPPSPPPVFLTEEKGERRRERRTHFLLFLFRLPPPPHRPAGWGAYHLWELFYKRN